MSRNQSSPIYALFGAAVRSLREQRGLSLEGLAQALGIRPKELRDLEAGGPGPKVSFQKLMQGLGRALDVTLQDIVEQERRHQLAEKLRRLADVLEAPKEATGIENLQILILQATLQGDEAAFAKLTGPFRAMWLEQA